ncbi:MAG: nucleotidyltransferase domain-containing protein [Pseudomonadota bacterium]
MREHQFRNGLRLIRAIAQWARTSPDADALALVGSWARGSPSPGSDIDLVVVGPRPRALAARADLPRRFGQVARMAVEDWGIVRARRVHYRNGLEVEFGFAPRHWCAPPIDPGTAAVIANGLIPVVDPQGRLAASVRWVRGGQQRTRHPQSSD